MSERSIELSCPPEVLDWIPWYAEDALAGTAARRRRGARRAVRRVQEGTGDVGAAAPARPRRRPIPEPVFARVLARIEAGGMGEPTDPRRIAPRPGAARSAPRLRSARRRGRRSLLAHRGGGGAGAERRLPQVGSRTRRWHSRGDSVYRTASAPAVTPLAGDSGVQLDVVFRERRRDRAHQHGPACAGRGRGEPGRARRAATASRCPRVPTLRPRPRCCAPKAGASPPSPSRCGPELRPALRAIACLAACAGLWLGATAPRATRRWHRVGRAPERRRVPAVRSGTDRPRRRDRRVRASSRPRRRRTGPVPSWRCRPRQRSRTPTRTRRGAAGAAEARATVRSPPTSSSHRALASRGSFFSPVLCSTLVRVVGAANADPATLVSRAPAGSAVVRNDVYLTAAAELRPVGSRPRSLSRSRVRPRRRAGRRRARRHRRQGRARRRARLRARFPSTAICSERAS